MADPMNLTPAEQSQIEQEEQLAAFQNQIKQFGNPHRILGAELTKMGMPVPPQITAKGNVRETELNMLLGGVPQDEIAAVKDAAMGQNPSAVTIVLDGLLRTGYTMGAWAGTAGELVVPPESEQGRKFTDAYNAFATLFTTTGDPAMAVLGGLGAGNFDMEDVSAGLKPTLGLAKMALKNPQLTPVLAATAMKNLSDLWFNPDRAEDRTGVMDRVINLDAAGSFMPIVYSKIAQEVFSGLPGFQGDKEFPIGALKEGRNLKEIDTDLVTLGIRRTAKDLAAMGVIDTLSKEDLENLDSTAISFNNPLAKLIEVKTSTGTMTIPASWGGALFGPRIGVTKDGDGVLSIKQGGLFDPTFDDVVEFVGDVALDPTTYVTGGASGLPKALGRGLTKRGVLKLGDEFAAETAKRAKMIRAAQGDDEAMELLVKQFDSTPVELAAEQRVIDMARRDTSLLVPRGQMRFMGQPIGAMETGGESIARVGARALKVEKLFDKFNSALVEPLGTSVTKTGALLAKTARAGIENTFHFSKELFRKLDPSLTKNMEWIFARAQANGLAANRQTALKRRLELAEITKTENDVLIDLLSDPLTDMKGTPGLTKNAEKLVSENTLLDSRYQLMNQELTKGMLITQASDLVLGLKSDGQTALASKIERRITETLRLDPEAKHLPRVEIFFKNKDSHLKKYMTEISSAFVGSEKRIQAMAEAVKVGKKSNPQLTADSIKSTTITGPDRAILRELIAAFDKGGKQGVDRRVKSFLTAYKDKGQMLMAKGDHSAVITPLTRDDLLELVGNIKHKRGVSVPRLKPVTNVREHILRRGSVAHNKEAMHFLLEKATKLSKSDPFARRVFEEHLTPVGVLEHNPNVNRGRVDAAFDEYLRARKGSAEEFAETAAFEPTTGKGSRVKLKSAKPAPGAPMTKAMGMLKTREEKELFLRQWIMGEGPVELGWEKGSLPHRLHKLMLHFNDNVADVGWGKEFSPEDIWRVTPGAEKPGQHADWAARQWTKEVEELNTLLEKEGIRLNDIIRPKSLLGQYAPDGSQFVSSRKIKRTGPDSYKISSDNTGEHLWLPESLDAELNRLSDSMLSNPEVGALLRSWDAMTNLLKLGLTSVGGFPAFQNRNLYSNVAFGVTGAHIHLLNQPNMKRMFKTAWSNSDPSLAVTGSGYKGSLRASAMNELSTELGSRMVTLEETKAVVKDLYSGGKPGSLKPGRRKAQQIAADDKAAEQEAKILMDQLNDTVIVRPSGETVNMKEFLHHMRKQGVEIDPKVLAEFTGFAETFSSRGGAFGTIMDKATAARDKLLRMNTFYEQWSRQQVFASGLARGQSFQEAGRFAKKWLLDYQALSPVEKSVMKRIFPFYTFYRRSLPLMLESTVTRPGVTSLQAKILRSPNEPVFSYDTEHGEAIQVSRDGKKLTLLTGVDLPVVQSLKLLNVLANFIPGNDPGVRAVGKQGLRDVLTMAHPAIHGLFSAPDGYEMFRGETVDKKKLNALGMAMEAAGVGEGSLWTKQEGRDGRMDYMFNQGRMVSVINMTGFSRLMSNVDQLVEAGQDLSDGQITGLIRWMSGIKWQQITGAEEEMLKAIRTDEFLKDEAVRRGLYQRVEMDRLPAPGAEIKRKAIRRQDRMLLGKD